MNALVIEDKTYIRKGLINLLNSVSSEVNIIGECGSVQEAVIVAKACKPELVFLDINLSDGTGFDFLDQTEHLDFKVIFTTAYEEFALKALKTGAIDYLMKPIDPDELRTALKKVENKSSAQQKEQLLNTKKIWYKDENTLVLSLSDSFQVIDLAELLYCESDRGYTTFHLSNGKTHMASKPIKSYEQQLEKAHFTRPHQSFMVNLKFIDKYDKSGSIYLKNGTQIPVSFRKKDAFLTTLLEYNK